MIILSIRTDKPEAEIGLFDGKKELSKIHWQAHRKLAETIHLKIKSLLDDCNKSWQDIEGVVCFKGPGSFTGLRVGLSVGNALAYSLKVPIAGTTGKDWEKLGIEKLKLKKQEKIVLPEYGALAHVTQPKK